MQAGKRRDRYKRGKNKYSEEESFRNNYGGKNPRICSDYSEDHICEGGRISAVSRCVRSYRQYYTWKKESPNDESGTEHRPDFQASKFF